jgi:D-sedoheptulose 7-phosphate isomerase
MARRFSGGGKLVVFGNGTAATDAEHIAVEFVHPVIVGKRALPALSLSGDFAHQVRQWAAPADIALGVAAGPGSEDVARGLEEAYRRGCLTVALLGGDAGPLAGEAFVDHAVVARSDDPQVIKEVHVTAYHVLWELAHVFLEEMETEATPAACTDEVCITCSDQGVPVRVVELRAPDLALVDTGSGLEEISVALVDARVGGRVLVHAGEAIATLPDAGDSP